MVKCPVCGERFRVPDLTTTPLPTLPREERREPAAATFKSKWLPLLLSTIAGLFAGISGCTIVDVNLTRTTHVERTFSPIGEAVSVKGNGELQSFGFTLLKSDDIESFLRNSWLLAFGILSLAFLLSAGIAFTLVFMGCRKGLRQTTGP